MSKDFRATALERAVGRRLEAWRGERGLSLVEAGSRAGFSSAKLSQMENAMQPSAPLDIVALGYVYKVPILEWQLVLRQAERAAMLRQNGTVEGKIFDPAEDLPLLVAEATSLRAFTTDTIPTIFQLRDYTAATAHQDNLVRTAPVARLRHAWASRVTGKDPLKVEAVFPETVLRQVVGGPRVMRAQLLHLMEVSEQPDVSVRVVPHCAGAYPAMGCPFAWLSFPHRQHDDIVYTETFLRSEYVENREQVEEVAARFSALWKLALEEGQSTELIAEAAASL
ncbi:helix-turn-helix domain-containing protein [Lentzea cavernae]|uniref:helix-turn-helix domain-containing protein n=1 Tax=Lentzea cavernae TaxID=2020703 RepID=UPI0017485BD9|nr:helix-turn-helix transcriptional regulator [Lentzea cavernae]